MENTGRRYASLSCPQPVLLLPKPEESRPFKNEIDFIITIVRVGTLRLS